MITIVFLNSQNQYVAWLINYRIYLVKYLATVFALSLFSEL